MARGGVGRGPSGSDLAAPDVERVLVFERLGKGEMGERELAGWLRG